MHVTAETWVPLTRSLRRALAEQMARMGEATQPDATVELGPPSSRRPQAVRPCSDRPTVKGGSCVCFDYYRCFE
jgi:hypothetical protein